MSRTEGWKPREETNWTRERLNVGRDAIWKKQEPERPRALFTGWMVRLRWGGE